jgi:hypothetical protein
LGRRSPRQISKLAREGEKDAARCSKPSEDDLELKAGSVHVKGAPGMLQIARRARRRERIGVPGSRWGRGSCHEGRGWRGFHHHATLCIAAYGFLIAERGATPPSGPGFSSQLSRSAIPDGYRPRGAANPTRTAHPQLDRHNAPTPHRRSRQDPPEMPLLQCADPQNGKNSRLLT